MARNRTKIGMWLVILATATIAVGCSGGRADEGGSDTDATPASTSEGAGDASDADAGEADSDERADAVPVEVVSIASGRIEAVLRFSSNVEAEDHVEVHSQASRQVVALEVEEGERVRAGDLLVRLQDDAQRTALAKVQSELRKARREFERQERLFEQDLIPEQDFNDVAYEIERLELALEDAERELSYTEVRAPISGTITRRLVNLGDQIQVNQHLFDIVDFDSLVALVYVPEKHLAVLEPGQPARIAAPSLPAAAYRGRIERIAPVVDADTGTVKVTVALGRQRGLRPGLYVDVDLVTAVHDDALLIPKRAVVYDDDRMFVYRVGDDSRATRVPVEPRLTDKAWVEPAEGFDEGDRVVIAGQTGLRDGALVEIPGLEPEAGEANQPDADEAAEESAAVAVASKKRVAS